jgi:hypothetical protein
MPAFSQPGRAQLDIVVNISSSYQNIPMTFIQLITAADVMKD